MLNQILQKQIFTAIFSFLFLFSYTANAQEKTALLWYTVASGVVGCPDATLFQDQVSSYLGYVPFAPNASLEFDVRIFTEGNNLKGRIKVKDQKKEEPGTREFSVKQDECADLVQAMAMATSLRIDPMATEDSKIPKPISPPVPATNNALFQVNSEQVKLTLLMDYKNSKNVEPIDQFTFHMRTGMTQGVGYADGKAIVTYSAAYEPLCAAPCDIDMKKGTYHLALAHPKGTPVEDPLPVSITGPATLKGTYQSRRPIRLAGAISGLSLLAAGGIVMLLAIPLMDNEALFDGLLIGGGAAMAVGLTLGWTLGTRPDLVDIQVIPAPM